MLPGGAKGRNIHQANYWSTLWPIPFIPFIKDLHDGTGCTLMKSADDTELGGVINRPGECSAIWRDLARLEKQARRNLMDFKKREMPHWACGRKKLKYQHRLGLTNWKVGCPYR